MCYNIFIIVLKTFCDLVLLCDSNHERRRKEACAAQHISREDENENMRTSCMKITYGVSRMKMTSHWYTDSSGGRTLINRASLNNAGDGQEE